MKSNASVYDRNKTGDTLLHKAAENGSMDEVQHLIEMGCDVNVRNENGDTPLHTAAKNGHLDIVKLLLNNGATLIVNGEGYTPLHHVYNRTSLNITEHSKKVGYDAAIMNFENLTKLFIDKGADINLGDGRLNRTPLHDAASDGYLEIVKYLIKEGAHVDARDLYNQTPLLENIAHNCSEEVVKFLIESGADVNARSHFADSVLHAAAYCVNVSISRILIKANVDVNFALERAITAEHNEAAKFFITYQLLYDSKATKSILVYKCNFLWQHWDECQKELVELRMRKLNNNNSITLFQFLQEDNKNKLASYVSAEDNLPEYKRSFPHYSDLLKYQFEKAIERKNLLERSMQVLECSNMKTLPIELQMKILEGLRNVELRTLLESLN